MTGRPCAVMLRACAIAVAPRAKYAPIGVQFAITNSGGLRADLTCPYPDIAGDFCPSFTPPPYVITRGQSLAVLPFGNLVFTVSINGAELKTYLENGVSLMPSAQGRFPQVSGMTFTFDSAAPLFQKVKGIRIAGSDMDAARSYTFTSGSSVAMGLPLVDFMDLEAARIWSGLQNGLINKASE